MTDDRQLHELYVGCIRKQLEELDLLTSIYCAAGELQLCDAGVVSDFSEFIASAPATATVADAVALTACLDYTIRLAVLQSSNRGHTLDVRIELPHLYPALEHPIITIHSPLLGKVQELNFRRRIADHVRTLAVEDDHCGAGAETYVYQIVAWIQEHIDDALNGDSDSASNSATEPHVRKVDNEIVQFERLWIYSHHIKSKTKRQEIVRQSQCLELSGFSRPGKPGIICVEGLQANTQEFWRVIKSMHWMKISICRAEPKNVELHKLNALRRFKDFREQLFGDGVDDECKDGIMDMGQFIKFLESHDSGYMKKELFGLD